MEFMYGLLTAAVFFCCLLLFFYLGIRYEQQKKPPDKPAPEDKDILKQQQIQEDFVKTMKYDVAQATARKQVT